MFDTFKSEVMEKALDEEQLFQKYFIDNQTYFFHDEINDINLEYDLKKSFAGTLGIHVNDIYIVGSGKTGFSIKPKCRGREFDGAFNISKQFKDRSDIDIAIVNSDLFDFVQENIYDWSSAFKNDWDKNKYYASGTKIFGVSLKYKFLEYLSKGWYRPDFAPNDYKLETNESGDNINNLKSIWSKKLNRNVAFAIYKNWHFFKKYQIENISTLKIEIESGKNL